MGDKKSASGSTASSPGSPKFSKVDVHGLPSFNPRGEPTTLAIEWKRWKRAFNLYLLAKGVAKDEQKVALLLHNGGLELQEVYYSVVTEDEEKSYSECLEVLDNQFLGKVSVPFERHSFRKMEQLPNETVDQFVCRLRQKATTCEFENVEDSIRDQLIDKCLNNEIRKKLLEKAGEVGFSELLDVARAHEAIDLQMKEMSISPQAAQQINVVKSKKIQQPEEKKNKGGGKRRCYRCNKEDHLSNSKLCPALGKECRTCHRKGHFAICCRTKAKPDGKERTYQLDEQDAYAFAVGDNKKIKQDGHVDLSIGGVQVADFLIDSGATCNVVDEETWSYLKSQRVECHSQKTEKKLFAFGQTEALDVLGSFTAEITCDSSNSTCNDMFTVVRGKARNLLGKTTAEKLKVLRVGPPSVDELYTLRSGVESQFPELFSGVGKLKDFKLKLHINDQVKPVAQPVRRSAFGLRSEVDDKLDELLALDIIEEIPEGPTGWVSPLVIRPKSDGDIRVCVDMRRANEAIEREKHPIPTLEEILYDLNGATTFSKLDLKWGFHQIELEEESRHITTFVTHRGLYRYKRLMFGITSAPEIYQKVISDVLQGCAGASNMADDIIVYGTTIEEHDKNLYKVLHRLEDKGLTLNRNKCQLRLHKLTYFGHELSGRGVSASEEKVAAVVNARPPQNIAEVRSFVQLVQYSSKFIPGFATVAEPLRELTRKEQPFTWGKEQEKSFQELKRLMTNAEALAYFKNECKTRIVADASPTGIGAVLLQCQGGEWRAVSYASRNLTNVERRYSQTEKEALALVWSCERFNIYVYGREFELETDHKPLECIFSRTSKTSARIERWVLRMQGYKYHVVYRPGKANIADCLSRLNQTNGKDPSGETEDFVRLIAAENTPCAMSPREVERESEKDPELESVRKYIQSGDWTECKLPNYLHVKDELCVLGKLVMRGSRIVIPKSLREQVLRLAHEGHQGIVKTKSRLRTKVWWPKIDSDAERLCKSCHGCQVVGQFQPPEPMRCTEFPTGPWQDVAADLMGPLPSGENILVVVDYYSRFFEVIIMHSTTTPKIISALDEMFCRYGFPFSIKTDNGPQFRCQDFEDYLAEHGIEHRKSPPLWPQANGEVERQNRTLLKSLKIAQVEKKPWREELKKFLLAYRSTPHSATGVTPASLMFGRELRTKLPELRQDKRAVDESVRDREWSCRQTSKTQQDHKRGAISNNISPGDKVLVKDTKSTGKLTPNFDKVPFTVIRKEGAEVTVQADDGTELKRNSSFVKPYIGEKREEPVKALESSPVERPRRETKVPERLKDYVLLVL